MSLRYASSIEDSEVRALLVAGSGSVPILRTSRISGRIVIARSSGVFVFPGSSTLELLLEKRVPVVSPRGRETLWKTPAASSLREPQSTVPDRHKSDSNPNDQVSAFAPIIWASCGLLRSVAELVLLSCYGPVEVFSLLASGTRRQSGYTSCTVVEEIYF